MNAYYNGDVMRRTLRAKFSDLRCNTRGHVITALEDVIYVKKLEAIYKTGEGSEWYLTFITDADVDTLGDGVRRPCMERGSVVFERIDRRLVHFRIHWFPLPMKKALVGEWLRSYESNITLDEDYMVYDNLNLKTGSLSGTMRSTEAQFNNIPYRAMVFNRPVLVTVVGRQPICLKCDKKGHQRSACPENTTTRKTYTKAVTMAAKDTNGESARLSADVPCTSSNEGSTGRPDATLSIEGAPVRPDGLTTSSGEGTQPSADVPNSSEGPEEDRCTESSEDPPKDRGTESSEESPRIEVLKKWDLSRKTRKRGRNDDTTDEEQGDNGKKLVKEEELERIGPLALLITHPGTIDVD